MARRRATFRAARSGAKLGAALLETGAASAHTISLRTQRMIAGGGRPDAEYARMTLEKAAAAALAGTALYAQAPALWRLWLNAAAAPWAFAAGSARAAGAALAPYRRAARANARRLSRKRLSK
jgi:hypothetical protein